MKDPTTGRRAYGRTRWRRFGILLAPAFTAVAVMMYLVASGVIAVSFAISGIPFTLNAANMSGNGFVQYAAVDQDENPTGRWALAGELLANASAVAGTVYDAATVTVLHDGTISALDQTICVPIPVGRRFLSGGTQGRPVGGKPREFLDTGRGRSAADRNDATFTNIDIGRDAQNAINQYVPAAGITGADGLFSQSAELGEHRRT